jgi:hypothetical protein
MECLIDNNHIPVISWAADLEGCFDSIGLMSALTACFPILAENLIYDSSLVETLLSFKLLTQSEAEKLRQSEATNHRRQGKWAKFKLKCLQLS